MQTVKSTTKGATKRAGRLCLVLKVGVLLVLCLLLHLRALAQYIQLLDQEEPVISDAPPEPKSPVETVRAASVVVDSNTSTSTGSSGKFPSLSSIVSVQNDEYDPPDFVHDELCGGCRLIMAAKARGMTCGHLLNKTAEERSISLVEAVPVVAEDRKVCLKCSECTRCLSCPPANKKYWRYDAAAPTIRHAISHTLPSVSVRFRIPESVYQPPTKANEQLQAFFAKPQNVYPTREYYFEYNPSIVVLPPTLKAKLPISQSQKDETVYLASYRLSNLQSCFDTDISLAMIGGDWSNRPETSNLLGLALLRQDLTMIQDVVFRVPDMFVPWVDFRLFILKGQIYLASNCQLIPIWLQETKPPQQPDERGFYPVVIRMKNRFPSPLIVYMHHLPSVCSRYNEDLASAKNLNYFVDAIGNIVVEFQPHDPRVLRHVRPDVIPIKLLAKPDPDVVEYRDAVTPLDNPSFYTREELDVPNRRGFFQGVLTGHRGSTCCIGIDTPSVLLISSSSSQKKTNSTRLLMGIAHVKTPFGRRRLQKVVEPNHYLSRFYAFEPTPPYAIVAYSGLFCLPAVPKAGTHSAHPLTKVPIKSNLTIAGTMYRCPAIHFITGMTVKADDPSRLIIGYGVEDCTSWFIEVDLQEVLGLLVGPPQARGEEDIVKAR
ncbi:Inherit from COG: Hemolysin-type calcium-binding [Seminavis robusta]|uniref:Inherit from COG: Hemolysin-type calcium-binding n=1 Tax=Seminavis robusta TaxID=568900 RepID=A0A9N8HCY4_9STRA|nr:Inherit from COG: Hemolysin-type calcium-binding [Seminavis robusta]|eukprot:Sro337_g120580.1 Inherit from COG: Hemolysin-type calcium-binding (658) ;mRNA; r:27561-29629